MKGLLIITLRIDFFFNMRYVGETLGEDNIIEVHFEYLKKYAPVKLKRYIRNHVVEASRRKCPFNAWGVNVLKGHNRDIRRLYRVNDIDRGYRLENFRTVSKQVLYSKSKIPRYLKANMSRNERL